MKSNNNRISGRKRRVITAAVAVLLVAVLAAGGYAGNMFGYFNGGNASEYSVKKSEKLTGALEGRTVIFLGSSVTYGFAAKGESFADYLAAQDGLIAVKEAKSGTTLVDDSADSYIARMKKLDTRLKADAFVCQLSTNDATQGKPLGTVGDGFEAEGFDTHTIAGAIEYIIAYAKATWNCPVIFYTNPQYDSEEYARMVALLGEIAEKWEIGVIDLWHNEAVNSLDGEQLKIYMNDSIHPTRAGYRELWAPIFREYLEKVLSEG